MLVLTRRVGESIRIRGDIVIKVTAIDGQRVRLGIEAPREVPIWRSELQVLNAEEPEVAVAAGR